jgi:uridylate kinase
MTSLPKDRPRFRRILLKLSGEALAGPDGFGIDASTAARTADLLRPALEKGIQIGLVVGAGNLFRGAPERQKSNSEIVLPRTMADAMGMMGTVMNALALSEVLSLRGIPAKAFIPFVFPQVAETFNSARAIELMSSGTVAVFGGGTGNPFFTTDTAAALRAAETGCDALLKATKVDGVYDRDPVKHKDAQRFASLSYDDVLARKLGVMDLAAVSLCMENRIPIAVFDFEDPAALTDICFGTGTKGTIIGGQS